MDGILVLIVKEHTKASDGNIKRLKRLFSSEIFRVKTVSVEGKREDNVDLFLTVLRYSLSQTEGGVIVVRDRSVSYLSPRQMEEKVKSVPKRADLFFMTKWGDRCNTYKDVEGADGSIKWSSSVTSDHAVFFSREGRKKILDTLDHKIKKISDRDSKKVFSLKDVVDDAQVLRCVSSPNVIDFDVNLATSNADFEMINECSPVPKEEEVSQTAAVVWFVIFIVLIVLLAWLVIEVAK